MADQSFPSEFGPDTSGSPFDGSPSGGSGADSILNILWRYKWMVAVFVGTGLGIGYWMYQQKPTTYQATTQLQFKSNAPLQLDSTTGAMVGGLPSANLMTALITSDAIIKKVATDKSLLAVPALSGMSTHHVGGLVRSGISFRAVTTNRDAKDRMIAAISFNGRDPEVCKYVVVAMEDAIESHFSDERDGKIGDFKSVIIEAQDKLGEEQNEIEERYSRFRAKAQLEWSPKGEALNPHRERQTAYQAERQEIEREKRDIEAELKLAESIEERNPDPLLVVQMIGRLSNVVEKLEPSPLPQRPRGLDMKDLVITQLDVEQQLIPLIIKRETLIADLGDSHPSVKALTQQINSTREKLNELDLQRRKRMEEMIKEFEEGIPQDDQQAKLVEKAKEAITTYKRSLQERRVVLSEQIMELTKLIDTEKEAADKLTKQESDDAMFRRQIDRYQRMLVQLEQTLQSLDVADFNGGIEVSPILDSGGAYPTGPDLKKDLMMYGMAGLALAGLLAFGFEASAKMFRSAEEITRELRLPVMTHIPLDESRLKQGKVAENDELSKLDPKLSVIHRPYSSAAEAIRGVRTAILFDRRAHGSKVFQVTSPLPGDGKSTVSANIACSLAQSGKRVLLIDLDLRSPRLSLRFNLGDEKGLTNVLNGEISPFEAVSETPVDNLHVLGCGPLPANPAEALTLSELGDVFDWARAQYDFVIVDTPPLLMVTDPSIVTTYVDAAILVMRIRRRCKPNALEAVAMLRAAGARIMGVIINKVDEMSHAYKTSASGSYQSIGYGYGDKYRRRYQKEAKSSDTYVVKGKSSEEGFSKPLVASRNGNGRNGAAAKSSEDVGLNNDGRNLQLRDSDFKTDADVSDQLDD